MLHTNQSELPVIELVNAACRYDHQAVFDQVNLKIYPGQFVGIVGPNGAGKTTLLKAILGIIKPSMGTLRNFIGGNSSHHVGYVPQLESIDWNFPVTVEQVVMMGRHREMGILPWPSSKDRKIVGELLERLGIAEYSNQQIRNLSGGQQQRVFLARALIGNPSLLLLDEPTAGVDVKTQHDILHLLGEINMKGVTIVLSTHDLNAVAAHLPHIICFNHRVIAEGTSDQIFRAEVLRKTYGSEMMVVREGSIKLVANRDLVLKSHE